MNNLSKSKYVSFCQCPKIIWLDKYKPEEKIITSAMQEIFDNGNIIGDLAMGLFGDYVEVTAFKENNKIDILTMCKNTQREILNNTSVICEASFIYDGLYCAVDILKYDNGYYNIYEVKSSTEVKDVYLKDCAYQKYVLENCGVKVNKVYIVTIDSSYERIGELDLNKFFAISDVTSLLKQDTLELEENITAAKEILLKTEEPLIDIGEQCKKPYECSYCNYCFRNIPKPNVFELYLSRKKFSLYSDGIITLNDVRSSNLNLTKVQTLQVEYFDKDDIYIEKDNLTDFLNTFKYPLYYLDFETMNPAIPPFDHTRPYSQTPFQYSLHIQKDIDSKLIHKEFLGDGSSDPRRGLAIRLCEDIGDEGSIVAYNKSFETSRIKELAKLFPDLKDKLLKMIDRFVDLLDPFKSGYVYKKEMGGSFSIKSVLPSFFKDDKELDYNALPGVHNGSEAKNIYPKINEMSIEERLKTIDGLLKYCHLDTLAMVKVHDKLKELAN